MVRSIAGLIVASLLTVASPAVGQAVGSGAGGRDLLALRVFLGGVPVGNEQVVVQRVADGWKVSSTGQWSPPISLYLRTAELLYDENWAPRSLLMQGTIRDEGFETRVTVSAGTQATVTASRATQSSAKVDTIATDALLLPNNFFGAYVALARRLLATTTGSVLHLYVAPQAQIDATLDGVLTERLRTTDRVFDVRRHRLTMKNPGGPLAVEVWTEADGRLARVSIPAAGVDVAREDVAAVTTREEKITRANDEQVMILANGFNLAATISRPPGSLPPAPKSKVKPPRLPVVVLVAGSGPLDRDEVVAGIPVFGQLASALADAGYLVVRYDKRGVGQSGGRSETVTLQDYADDVLAVVKHLRDRKDVDKRRIFVVGHSEGAWVGLLAASRQEDIAGLVLAAGPSGTGDELVLEQQQYLLARMGTPAAEAEAKVAMQKRINSAVMFGTSWEGVSPTVRKQAETPWFASFLRFDPAKVMRKVRQPLLVVQGDLDRQVAAHHAGKLVELARARKKGGSVAAVTIAGVNHLFVPATTGDVDEYASLPVRTISPEWPKAIAAWLSTAVPST
jgi:pimeloyl-ACP methyl ester carboxylesterase